MMHARLRKILPLLLVVFLVTACESTSTRTGSKHSTGAPGQAGTVVEGIVVGTQEDLSVNVGDRVFFDTDRWSLKSDARELLDRQAVFLKRHSDLSVIVEGHADERGTREYNLALAERRANSVRDYLISRGVSATRVTTVSFGKERPAVLGSNPAAWAQNRRSVTVVRR